ARILFFNNARRALLVSGAMHQTPTLPTEKLYEEQAKQRVGQRHQQRLAPLSPAATMIIYRDLISHDELFSVVYKIREIEDCA
ncbi:hypothetical protein STEG23_001006, partial [Scotinomys teguina]